MAGGAIDWAWIERNYKTGQFSNVQLANLYNDYERESGRPGVRVSEAGIRKKAAENNWQKNLTADVRNAVEAGLTREGSEGKSDQEAIDEAATRAIAIVREHRGDIKALRSNIGRISTMLSNKITLCEDLQMVITADDLMRLASASSQLSNAMAKLVPLERQAFNIDGKNGTAAAGADEEVNEALIGAAFHALQHRRS